MTVLDIGRDIVFNESQHKYFLKDQEFTSVSSVISLFKPKFDPEGHIIRAVAKREGVSVEEIQEKWDKIKNDACDRGHECHAQLEHFINTGQILNDTYKDIVEQFAKIKIRGKLYSEVVLISRKHKISGTADLIEDLGNNVLNLGDFKTNKKLDKKSKYGNKLLYPLEKYDECEINNYTVQLNLYKYMLEEHGFTVKKMFLYYINPKTRILEIYKIPDIKEDINNLLEHYQSIQKI